MYASPSMEGTPFSDSDGSTRPAGDNLSAAEMLSGADRDICSSLAVTPLPYPSTMSEEEIALAQACRMLQFIQVARDFFPAMRDLADHPGWEIVLHIFIAGREGRQITTTELCERTGTWRPLAVRYIEMLFERGLIDRDVSGQKPDAWALSLTPSTEMRMQELLCGFSRGFVERDATGAAN